MSLPGLEGFRRDLLRFLADSKAFHFGLCIIGLVEWLSSSNKGSEAENWELLCEGASSKYEIRVKRPALASSGLVMMA